MTKIMSKEIATHSMRRMTEAEVMLKARRQFKVGDKVRMLMNDSPHWQWPTNRHKLMTGGVITNISPYRPEIDVRWSETGYTDTLTPVSVIKI